MSKQEKPARRRQRTGEARHSWNRLSPGVYSYRGYTLFRRDQHLFAATPWKVQSIRGADFRTMADAMRWIDARVEMEKTPSTFDPEGERTE